MATQLLRTRPERVAATVILAGFVLGTKQPADSELAETKPRVIYCRGLNDGVISSDAVARTESWLARCTNATIKTYEGLAHSVDERVMEDISNYLESMH